MAAMVLSSTQRSQVIYDEETGKPVEVRVATHEPVHPGRTPEPPTQLPSTEAPALEFVPSENTHSAQGGDQTTPLPTRRRPDEMNETTGQPVAAYPGVGALRSPSVTGRTPPPGAALEHSPAAVTGCGSHSSQEEQPAFGGTPYHCTIRTDNSWFGRKKVFRLLAQEPDRSGDNPDAVTERPLMVAEYETGNIFSRNGQFKVTQCSDEAVVGYIRSPGWFADRSMFHGKDGQVKGALHFTCTSRNGKLMDMEAVLPHVHRLKRSTLFKMLTGDTSLSDDLAHLLCDFVTPLSYWSEDISDMGIKNCNVYPRCFPEKCVPMVNKKPVWNAEISAFTLEFGGRAQIPSVHNFQLACSQEHPCVLQLGKVEAGLFNMDFGYPLSTFQAFAICVSVMQRTFVHD